MWYLQIVTGYDYSSKALTSDSLTDNDSYQLYVTSNSSFEKYKFYIQMTKGNVRSDYEEYSGGQPSPNPDYPQEIKTIENSLKITSCNKNLFDSNREVNSTFTSSIKEALETYKTTGKYATGYLTNSDSITSYNVYTTCFVKIKANTNYCISDNSIENKGFSCISILDKDGNVLYHSPAWQGSVYRINGLPNACYVAFGTRTINYINVQLEEGTTNTSYEQHLETQINANLPDGEFIGKINDTYKDTLNVVYKDDGHYHLILNKMIGKVVLNGSETFYINAYAQTLGYNIFVYKGLVTSLASGDNPCKSNYFIHYSWGQFNIKDAIYQN